MIEHKEKKRTITMREQETLPEIIIRANDGVQWRLKSLVLLPMRFTH
jgi:hypothetical protein